MSPRRTTPDTRAVNRYTREVQFAMPQAYVVIFLLFFAVLAFAWFYWQRAKARGAGETTVDRRTDTTAPSDRAD